MKNILAKTCILFWILTIHNNTSAQSPPKWLTGVWTGVGYQEDAVNQHTWEIRLEFDMQLSKLLIEYPTLDCNGFWMLSESGKNRAVFTEYITEGRTRCADEGTVIVTRVDDRHISVSYFFMENGRRTLAAFSTLVREQ